MMRRAALLALAVLGSSSALAGQSNASDPWEKVPPLPTTCYVDRAFSTKLHDIHTAMSSDVRKQTLINEELQRQFQALGQQEIMRRMIDFMSKDPQKATKMMEAQQAAATGVRVDIASADEAKKEREAEFDQLSAAFTAEMKAAAKPFEQRRAEIMKTSRRVINEENWEFTTKAAENEFNDLITKQNADYEKRCAAYFGANGKFPSWLASYKSTVLEPIARSTAAHEGIKEAQMAVLEAPAGAGYRSTAQMEAVRDYTVVVRKAFDLRLDKLKEVH